MTKDEIRLEMRKRRRSLSQEEVIRRSTIIQRKLYQHPAIQEADTVMVYMDSFKEPQTMPIILELQKRGKRIVVPVTHMDTGTLSLSYLDANLKKGAYGILEPASIRPADGSQIDVVLVPGLAFDHFNHRMGFGKGYYDKLLKHLRAYKIGICYAFQVMEQIPVDENDIPMDIVITDE